MTAADHAPPSDDRLRYAAWRSDARRSLDDAIGASGLPGPLKDAIRYGSTAPEASRWRAVLVLQVGHVLGTAPDATLAAAVAVEALHCATLSIDDLPSMDDAAERRGQPSMHRRFNEAMAIQASLWLLGTSRTQMASAAAAGGSAAIAARLSALQQRTEDELQLGQFMDVLGSLGKMQVDGEHVARLKCGRLFALAAQAAAWIATSDGAPRRDAERIAAALDVYGEELGLAYQIKDDLDDLDEDAAATTWAGGDERGRPTVVGRVGRAAALEGIDRSLARAAAALDPLVDAGIDCAPLASIVDAIFGRR